MTLKNTGITVPLLDLKGQYQTLKEEIRPLLDKICDEQMFILGENVKSLEAEIADYCQCAYGIGVSSGTDALLLALMAFEIGYGDEVITSPYTFFATAGAIARTGAAPVFCDIDEQDFNLSPDKVKSFIETQCEVTNGKLFNTKTGRQVKALIPVHLYGQMADMDPLLSLAKQYGLHVIEDAAQAIGSQYKNAERAGSISDIGCFSFFPSKNLGAFGDAGLCTTNDGELAEKLNVLRVHGSKPKYYHPLIGGNFRIDELQAAVLRVKLKYLDGWTSQRQANADFYDKAFGDMGFDTQFVIPRALPGYRHIYNQYVVRVERRDELKAWLAEHRIGTEIYYPVPLHLQPCFEYLGYKPGDFPVAEAAAKTTLALPIYPELTREQLKYVVDTVAAFYKA